MKTPETPEKSESIEIGGFKLTKSGGKLWIIRRNGEAMETHPSKLAKAILDFWKREF